MEQTDQIAKDRDQDLTALGSVPSAPSSDVDSMRNLRNTLGQFATGVTIVTALDPAGDMIGMTVNSFSSVSLDPPLVLWNLGETNYGYDVYQQADYFCINILAADQSELARKFAQASDDKFNTVKLKLGNNGIPLLEGCLAYLECTKEAQYPGGDHVIIIGRVERFLSTNRQPLLFYTGQFFDLAKKSETTEKKEQHAAGATPKNKLWLTRD